MHSAVHFMLHSQRCENFQSWLSSRISGNRAELEGDIPRIWVGPVSHQNFNSSSIQPDQKNFRFTSFTATFLNFRCKMNRMVQETKFMFIQLHFPYLHLLNDNGYVLPLHTTVYQTNDKERWRRIPSEWSD
jgi:hypothetical protein